MANDDLGEMERDATVSRLQAEYYFTRAAQCLAADNPKAEREHRKEAREWMQRHSVAIEKKANDLIMKLAEQQDEDDKLYQSFVQITGDEEDDAGDPADAAGSSAG